MKKQRVFRQLAGLAVLAAAGPAWALSQPTSSGPHAPPPNGPRHAPPTAHVLTGATVHVSPGFVVEGGQLAIRDGRIVWVGEPGERPISLAGFREWDATGLHVYPGLIDAYVEVEAPEPDADAPGAHWNAMVTPRRSALDGDGISAGDAGALRELGFVAAHVVPEGGVFQGSSAVVSLAAPPEEESAADPPAYREGVFDVVSFDRRRGREYPGSLMGAIALIRQTLLDADWRRARMGGEGALDPSCLDAIGGPEGERPLLFNVDDELNVLRAAKIIREFERDGVIVGSGDEYKRFDAIVNLGLDLIVPLDFPEAPKIGSLGELDATELGGLMAWEQAPTNPRRLRDGGVSIALTSSKIDKRSEFPDRVQRAIAHGLSANEALEALTFKPAVMLGVEDELGTLHAGKIASFVVTDGPLFDEGTTIRDVWIDGRRHEITPPPKPDISGTWDFTFAMGDEHEGTIIVDLSDKGRVSVTLEGPDDEPAIEARKATWDGTTLSYLVDNPDDSGTVISTAVVENDEMLGQVVTPGGRVMPWTATRRAAEEDEEGDDGERDEGGEVEVTPELPGYPFGPYAMERTPPQEAVVLTNATIWTSGPRGVIERGFVYIADGEIIAVQSLPDGAAVEYEIPEGVRVIDCEGKHITPGIIDCHSHTGMSGGVNEASQASTAEVRVADITDPDTISWYRQLAGGVTAINTLHGSANPIGGQSQVSKIRWGAIHPDDMHFDAAPAGIKFALGENVKQSNWGDDYTTRYPQTRMGVETIIRDRFTAAKEYLDRGMTTEDGRRDLELEALAQILAGERFIHCHSYRQDEILMLCRVAADFGFTIGTFQHVLEGYKVAEAIRGHAIGASAFSDWWAYKVEVQDAIPHNGAIMHDQGVAVSFNSDSNELARRLNTEAAKAVRYGGVQPEEALKFVTLNPAIQLGIDDRVGSLEPGKDADLAVWSGDPLSTLTRCERTFVDGREYFSLERDAELRERIRAERERLVQKLIAKEADEDEEEGANDEDDAKGDTPTELVDAPPDVRAMLLELERRNLDLLRRGIDPDSHRCGECGVTLHDLLNHK